MAAVPTQSRDEFGPSLSENSVLRFLTTHRSCAVWEGKDPWVLKCRGRNDELRKRRPIVKPYQDDLAHLPPFCVAGRDVWTARVPLVCFWLVEKHTPNRVLRQFGMVQEIPPYVDTDDTLHDIDLKGKIEGDMSHAHPYFDWYDRVTWRFVDHTSASLLIMVASHKQMLTQYTVGSPMYKHISAVLKYMERFHRITAKLPLEKTDGANPNATEDTGRPSTSSNCASHSHGQRGASHQVVNRPDPPPPPYASPVPEFPPPPHASPTPKFPPRPHASPSPDIPPRTAYAVPDLQIPLPTAHASSHLEIPSHTPHTFFDPAHLSFTLPSFDLGYDFS
nr:serine/threonine-protein phosphatase 7 long form like [Quercus suber]